ncbi:MAG: hypothetical protein ACTS42_01505 [Candidatus Hodgkinia cicadicola]
MRPSTLTILLRNLRSTCESTNLETFRRLIFPNRSVHRFNLLTFQRWTLIRLNKFGLNAASRPLNPFSDTSSFGGLERWMLQFRSEVAHPTKVLFPFELTKQHSNRSLWPFALLLINFCGRPLSNLRALPFEGRVSARKWPPEHSKQVNRAKCDAILVNLYAQRNLMLTSEDCAL